TDGALAKAVPLEHTLVGCDRECAGEEGAVLRGGAERHQKSPVQAECGDAVADALFGFWRGGANCFAQLVERGPLIDGDDREIAVDRLACGFGCHGTSSLLSVRSDSGHFGAKYADFRISYTTLSVTRPLRSVFCRRPARIPPIFSTALRERRFSGPM